MQKILYVCMALFVCMPLSFETFALDIEEGGLEKRQNMKKEIIQERQNFEKCEDLDCYNATANRVIEKFYHFPDLDKKAYNTFVYSTFRHIVIFEMNAGIFDEVIKNIVDEKLYNYFRQINQKPFVL